jgi:diacylglycerol kinase (ATP)
MSWFANRLRSFAYAGSGLVRVFSEPSSKIHAVATLLVLALGFWLDLARTDWLWLMAAVFAVWIAEAFNTALELLCNAVSREHHPLLGAAKDVAAAAVLLASLFALGVGVLVLGPQLLQRAH